MGQKQVSNSDTVRAVEIIEGYISDAEAVTWHVYTDETDDAVADDMEDIMEAIWELQEEIKQVRERIQ